MTAYVCESEHYFLINIDIKHCPVLHYHFDCRPLFTQTFGMFFWNLDFFFLCPSSKRIHFHILIVFSWSVMPCTLAGDFLHFERSHSLILQGTITLKIEAVCSERLLDFYEAA